MPEELAREIAHFVEYYDNERYHESLNNMTPPDGCFRGSKEIETKRERIKRQTMQRRRKHNQHYIHSTSINVEILKSLP